MSDPQIRTLIVPPNRRGLPEGTWLRRDELVSWLRWNGYGEAAEELELQMNEGEVLMERRHEVRAR